MEMKKYVLIIFSCYTLAAEGSNYQVTLYNIPMANVKIEYADTILNKIKAIELNFSTETNNLTSQLFKIDNTYKTIINEDTMDILYFEKSTYQPNVTNKIQTINKKGGIIYQNTDILIPKKHFNIFSLLYYLENTPFEMIENEINLEREGLIYQCIIDKEVNESFSKFILTFNLIENNRSPVVEKSDIFTWALFKKGSNNKIVINNSRIESCHFKSGLTNLKASVK